MQDNLSDPSSLIPHPSSFLAPSLVVFSGPPGVGKSSLSYRLAQTTGWALIARDQFDRTFQRLELTAHPPITSYELMFDLAALNLKNRVSVILDAVFPINQFRHRAANIAEKHGARLLPVVCQCSDRRLWQQRVETRPEMIEGWKSVEWDEVRRVADYYEPWLGLHLALDAVESFDHNFELVLDFIRR